MKRTIEKIWRDHKAKIIIGGFIIGGTVIFIATRKTLKVPKIETVAPIVENFSWSFDTLNEAIDKFKAIEEACVNLGTGEVALFGPGASETVGYTVMYL